MTKSFINNVFEGGGGVDMLIHTMPTALYIARIQTFF